MVSLCADEWYRGICLDIDTDGGHTIYLIDWDDTYTIQQKHIRSIPEDVAEVPEFAIFCNMKGKFLFKFCFHVCTWNNYIFSSLSYFFTLFLLKDYLT